MRPAARGGGEARHRGQIGTPNDPAQRPPFRVMRHGDGNPAVRPVAAIHVMRGINVIGVGRRPPLAGVHLEIKQRLRQAGGQSFRHRIVHVLPLAGHDAMVKRRRDHHGQFQPYPRVGPQAALDGFAIGIAGDGIPARIVLQEAAVGHVVLVRPAVPGARRRHHDEVGLDRPQHVVAQPKALDDAGGKVLDNHVAQRDQLLGEVQAGGRGEVQSAGAFRLIVRLKRRAADRRVRASGAADLDDLGAHDGQEARRGRTGNDPAQVDHSDTVQRQPV